MSTNAEWGTKAWVLLVMIARKRGAIQYGQLATGHMGNLLDPMKDYCEAHDLSALTSLVVAKDTGQPTLVFVEDVDAERGEHTSNGGT